MFNYPVICASDELPISICFHVNVCFVLQNLVVPI